MDPPGQTLHRRLSRYFWGFPPFLALVETIALAVHFQDMDMVGEAVQQSPGQRSRTSAARHCSLVPKASRNASSLRPSTRDATLNPITVTPSYRTH